MTTPAADSGLAPQVQAITETISPAGPASAGTALDGVRDLIATGGPVVVILLCLSVVALTIIVVKLFQFSRAGLSPTRAAREAVTLARTGRIGDGLDRIGTPKGAVDRVVAIALRGRMRGGDEARIREEVLRVGGDELENLRSYLRPLEVIGALAPLLGLFGTVLGMIEAFRRLSEAGTRVDPAILSNGIWEALLTTAVGLALAIPVVGILSWLERRVERTALTMDSLVTRIFTEDLSERRDDVPVQSLGAPLERKPVLAAGE